MKAWWSVVLLTACAAPAPAPPPEPAPPPPIVEEPEPVSEEPPFVCPEERGLCFRVEPASAELELNDESRGRLDEIAKNGHLFLALDAGIYQVTLRAEGYETWRAEVSVREGVEIIEVLLTLTPQE